MFKDKILLITGGTGSFGNAVLDEFLDKGLKEIRIFSRDEKKQDDMRKKYNNKLIRFYIGDVRDYDSINKAMKGVDYVFHAAALKQVPSCEFFPMEAVKTNIMGANNTMEAAINNGVKKMIVLSTDKAAYPINAMGMTKALMEKTAISKGRELGDDSTIFCITRYGNVMASRGSVIPLFVSQIEDNKPITVTNKDMTRFMMTLDEAVKLVCYALENGKQGQLFVQKSPACTIGTLAQAVKELKNSDSPIITIGTRHGEKAYETLVTKEEMVRSKEENNHYIVSPDSDSLNYEQYISKGNIKIDDIEEYNSDNTERLDLEKTKTLLKKLSMFK